MAAVKDRQMGLRECEDLEALWSVNVQIPDNKLGKLSEPIILKNWPWDVSLDV